MHGLEDPIPEGDPILQEMVDNDIIIIPTVSLFEAFLRYDERPDGFDDPILVGSVPTFLLERMRRADFMAEENARFRQIAARTSTSGWLRRSRFLKRTSPRCTRPV